MILQCSSQTDLKHVLESTQILPMRMCVRESQLAAKAEMKVCHALHIDALQETDSAQTHT